MMAVFERAGPKGEPARGADALEWKRSLMNRRDAGPGRTAFTLNSNEQRARLWADGRFE